MKRFGFLRYVLTLPIDVVAVLVVLFVRAAWGESLEARDGVLVVTLAPHSWPMRTWYRGWGGTTFGHAVMLAPLDPVRRAEVFAHELVHVEQIEGQAAAALVYSIPIAVTWHPLAGLAGWALAVWIHYYAASFVAVLRGESAYAGNVDEEAARAVSGG